MSKQDLLSELLRPTVEGLGCEFVGIQYHPNTVNALLRIFIDKEGGVVMDDCVEVTKQVSIVLDVEDVIPGKYTLEVSSPGLDRPLFSIDDFKKYIENDVKVRLYRPVLNQRNFKGKIAGVNGEEITLLLEGDKKVNFAFDQVDHAKLVAKV